MFRPTGTLFDVNNFFQQPSENTIFDGSTANDPTGLVERMSRLHSSIGFPSYHQPSWKPITRLNSYSPHGARLNTVVPTAGQQRSAASGSFYPTNSDPFRNETFRIRMSLPGYEQDDIKTLVENGRLVIFARHVQWLGNDDYVANEMKKHFFVPENCSFEDMKTNYDGRNLFINIPLRKTRSRAASTSSYSRRSSESYRSVPRQRQDSGTSIATVDNRTDLTSMTSGMSSAHTNAGHSYKSSYKVASPVQHKGSLTSLSTVGNNGKLGNQSIPPVQAMATNTTRAQSETESFDFEEFFRSSFRPSIVDVSAGVKKLTMSLPLPNISPDDINLSLRENLLTLKVDASQTNLPGSSKDFTKSDNDRQATHYVKTVELPPRTNLDGLRSRLDNGVLMIEAPYTVN